MHHCLIKPQTIIIPGVGRVEVSYTAMRTVLAIDSGGPNIGLVKFSPAGDLVSITVASRGTEVDRGD